MHPQLSCYLAADGWMQPSSCLQLARVDYRSMAPRDTTRLMANQPVDLISKDTYYSH